MKVDLGELVREELIETELQRQVIVQQLQPEDEVLRKKLEQLQKPPTKSKKSWQPPSLDRKGSRPGDTSRKRHDPVKRHEKLERQFVEHPDHVIDLKAEQCEHYQVPVPC